MKQQVHSECAPPERFRGFNSLSWAGRGLCLLLPLLLSGCAVFFWGARTLVATVPAQSPSPAIFNVALKMSTRSIEIDGLGAAASDQRLRVFVINRGAAGFEVSSPNGRFVPCAPDARVEVCAGSLPSLSNQVRLWVSGVARHINCEVELEVSNPSQFQNEIHVYACSESAPL